MKPRAAVLRLASALAVAACAVGPAAAQDGDAPTRWRIGAGPQVVPSYPGASRVSLRPFIDVSRARGDAEFAFEAADESAGFPVWQQDGFAVGPSVGFEGNRDADDLGIAVPKVDFTIEVGGFVQYQLAPAIRLRGEVRKGLGGHKGWIGTVGADYVVRDADRWLVSVGPRLTLTDARYQRAYFGVSPQTALATGLPAYDVGGGVQAVGANVGFLRQLRPRWGISSYAKYDRLVGDAQRSPLVRGFGNANQWSGGIALTYSFGGR